ncbi:MAG: hypothetical protein FWG25_03365, partial [Promicromonosporaceae bacterium]|nr:hypothetical protein [Promicromonosporaceae bacterium]
RAALDPTTLPGRLDYAPSPFEGWLRERLADRFAFVCVDDAAALSRYPKAVTQAGQVAGGATGAHGGHGRANVLGFTNERRLAQLDREIAAAREELRLAGDAFRGAEQRLLTAEQVAAAQRSIAETSWDDVDVETARNTREHWREVIARAKADNPMLDELQRRVANLRTALAESQGELGVAKHVRDNYRAQWERISEQVDTAQATLDDATEAGTVLGEDQRGYLDAIVAGVEEGVDGASSSSVLSPTEAMSAFMALATRVSDRLRTDLDRAALTARTSTEALAAAFERFVSRWPDPNLGTDPITSFRDFERILTDLETHRLGELADDWRRSLMQLTDRDLTELDHVIDRGIREIKERIAPVNEVLRDLPFADDEHRLQIDFAVVESSVVKAFRKELRELRTRLAAPNLTDETRFALYPPMKKLIDRIRVGAPDRAQLIDVRRQVRLSAEKVDLDANHVALYDHIGEKSGGESQELVAFIVGAALRYQLGDAGAERPRYAPVFLDEALIKADAQFSGRAIGAWRGLGFQLIVGAPNDKVSALEPHVSLSYVVTKNAGGLSQARPVVSLPVVSLPVEGVAA